MTWTAEREKTLRELWPDKSMSCSMIADRMGVTRNRLVYQAPKERSEAQRANDLRMAERARRQTNSMIVEAA